MDEVGDVAIFKGGITWRDEARNEPAAAPITVGSVVRLKSGGPRRTVARIITGFEGRPCAILVRYDVAGHREQSDEAIDMLEVAPPEDDSRRLEALRLAVQACGLVGGTTAGLAIIFDAAAQFMAFMDDPVGAQERLLALCEAMDAS